MAIRDGVEEMREGGQRVQTSSYEMGKSWKRDVLHACCCLVAQSWCPTLQPHGLQHARLPCPSPSPLQNCPGTIVNSTALYVWKLTRADLKILTTRNKICTNVRWWMLAYCGDHLTGKKKRESYFKMLYNKFVCKKYAKWSRLVMKGKICKVKMWL